MSGRVFTPIRMENPRKALISSALVSHIGGGPSPLLEECRHSAAYLFVSVTMMSIRFGGNKCRKISRGSLLRVNVGPTLLVNSLTLIFVALPLHCTSFGGYVDS